MDWTLAELADRAARALADVRVANGRVTGVPDARLIRWYTTIGLLDRPRPGPGRSARYGPRHLLQLVAVKRLQAQGQPLVDIQHRLAGATDATLRRIADLDPTQVDDAPVVVAPVVVAPVVGARVDVAPVDVAPVVGARVDVAPVVPATVDGAPRFWAAAPVDDSVTSVRGVRLGALTVLFPDTGELTPADLDEIVRAAQPLREVLRQKGVSS